MKLTKFIYKTTQYEFELPNDLEKEDFPFPVSEEEYQEYKEHTWECKIYDELFPKYCKENNFEVKSQEVIDYDVDKSYETIEVIFSFKDKYYCYRFDTGSWGNMCSFLDDDKELEEVEPYTETITVTKWRYK